MDYADLDAVAEFEEPPYRPPYEAWSKLSAELVQEWPMQPPVDVLRYQRIIYGNLNPCGEVPMGPLVECRLGR